MSEDISDAIELERQQIAAEIHDGLLPYLYATAAKISQLQKSNPELAEKLKDLASWVDQSRQIARDLMGSISYPPVAVVDPLLGAFQFVNATLIDSGQAVLSGSPKSESETSGSAQQAVCIRWDCLAGDPKASVLARALPEASAVTLYRVVSELIRNAVRHAGASEISVACTKIHASLGANPSGKAEGRGRNSHEYRVEVLDDGCGFDASQVDASAHHGLDWVRGRLDLIGWELVIESKTGCGTKVCVSGS